MHTQTESEVLPQQAVEVHSPEVHSLVHSYLATLLALSEALEQACPAVGGPHQQRLGRLRTRLSFDSNKEAIEASSAVVKAELRDFAGKASEHISLTTGEWKNAAEEIRNLGMGLIKRQRFYATRMRDIAAKLENGNAASLMSCAESMDNDSQSILSRMQDIMQNVATHLEAAEVVDHATGLMNRRELERRLELRRSHGDPVVRLRFEIDFEGSEAARAQVLRQVASRLTAQLRPEDLIARWSESEFLILFDGPKEVAERRGPQVAGLLSGRYSLDQSTIEVRATATLLDQ
ncbi:MAG: diguanylate cyclase [Bryobacteraceae bacterium]